MKIIEQSHEIIDRNQDPLKLIEICARTCYKSEDKITDTSARSMVKMLINKGHLSQIEMATAALQVPITLYNRVKRLDDGFLKFTKDAKESRYIISGNYRAFYEFFEKHRYGYDDVASIENYLSGICPQIFKNHFGVLKFITCGISIFKESEMTTKEKKVHVYRTVKFITSRSVTHELVRHRPCSFSQESQRYVRYDGDMEFIKPVWSICNDMKCSKCKKEGCHGIDYEFMTQCILSESSYQVLLKEDCTPEQAREVLPNSTKTEIIVTCNLAEWLHIFKLRCNKKAHPQIADLSKACLCDMYKELPDIFNNLYIKYIKGTKYENLQS